ncbi:uncharacterized protein Z518_04852 [Rhinocladiella mackenziei CBS 650.93]|uniref:Rhinocladiella mackenziei CBS 650.93 unplaced genomic scaffold supercont1.3, whole genome shotgun sequence n=1 Tax=Rhinocladiella mackenziei CBS 650.93 TaxID=1442369 RepID=A0A0D2IUN8_9EURO|nr:uncharacterized protein Z518_04852 [Rhinocladiella mackenziei CBS 650.93]KIX06876.1 hypothetical protein Z518_04852 [Rhinocladiella mackenziei CBS 650.93]
MTADNGSARLCATATDLLVVHGPGYAVAVATTRCSSTRYPGNDKNWLEAYTNPVGATYYGVECTRTTFYQKFFHELPSLADSIEEGKAELEEDRVDLNTWNSQARVFAHDAAHYNCFIDADGTVPFVDDLTATL